MAIYEIALRGFIDANDRQHAEALFLQNNVGVFVDQELSNFRVSELSELVLIGTGVFCNDCALEWQGANGFVCDYCDSGAINLDI